MATDATQQTVEIATDADVQQFLAEIRQLDRPRYYTIEIPTGSNCLSTHEEIREILAQCRTCNVQLTLRTDDPLRIELARILGLTVEHQAGTTKQLHDAPTRQRLLFNKQSGSNDGLHDAITVVGAEAVRLNESVDTPDPQTTHDIGEKLWSQFTSDSQPSFSFVITPPTKHRAKADRVPVDPVPVRKPQASRPTSNNVRRSRLGILSVLTFIGAIVGVTAILIGFLAPTATVRLTPIITPIETELLYGVAGSAETLSVTLEPSVLSTILTWEGTVPTTGERFVPDASAIGEILFTNPSTSSITVPAGTILVSEDGIEFTTSYDVAVPAADPFGTRMFGSAPVEIVAAIPGPEGNQDAMSITGKLDSGLFFQNQASIDGGTMRKIGIVSEGDIESLYNTAQSEFAAKASSEATSLLSGDQVIVSDSVSIGTLSAASLSAEAGTDADTVSLSATAPLTVEVFSPEELHQLARANIQEIVSSASSENEVLDPDSVWVSEPIPIGDRQGTAFKISAGGALETVIEQQNINNLRTELIGASEAEAIELVSQVDGVSDSNVEYGPDWLPVFRQPRLESRIIIEITD